MADKPKALRAHRHAMWALAILAWAGVASAQQLSSTSTVDALTALQSQKLLKQAELDNALLDKKIKDAQSGVSESQPESQKSTYGGVAQSPTLVPAASASQAPPPPPVYKGIFGSNGVLVATFLYAGGGSVDAKKGDHIPGGYIVRSLGVDGVTICKGKRCSQVTLSDQAPADPAAAIQQAANVPGPTGPTFLPISAPAPVR